MRTRWISFSTEEQELLARTAREFVSGRSSLRSASAQLRDADDADGFSRELWREMAALGWLGIVIPEEYGGAGLGYMDQMVVLEELGRGLMPEPMLSTVLLGANALLLGGSAAQKQEHLPAVAAGERLLTVAYQEARSRYDLAPRRDQGRRRPAAAGRSAARRSRCSTATSPTPDRDRRGPRAAPRDAKGITLFVARAPTRRASRSSASRASTAGTSRSCGSTTCGSTPTRSSATVDDGGDAARARARPRHDRALRRDARRDAGRVRDDQRVPEDARAVRRADRQLPGAQAPRREDVHRARAGALGGDGRAPRARRGRATTTRRSRALASLAKARCSDAFVLVGNECVQMHGGIGMTDEHDIGFFFKRARVAEMTFGDAACHRERTARLEGY